MSYGSWNLPKIRFISMIYYVKKNSEYRDHLETCVILACVIWWCVTTVGVDVMGQSNLALVICHSVRLSKAVQWNHQLVHVTDGVLLNVEWCLTFGVFHDTLMFRDPFLNPFINMSKLSAQPFLGIAEHASPPYSFCYRDSWYNCYDFSSKQHLHCIFDA